MSVYLQAYIGLGFMCLAGLPLPHSGTECRTFNLEQSNSVLQQCRPTFLAYRYVYWQSRQKRPSFFRPILISRPICLYIRLANAVCYHRKNLLHNIDLSFFDLLYFCVGISLYYSAIFVGRGARFGFIPRKKEPSLRYSYYWFLKGMQLYRV